MKQLISKLSRRIYNLFTRGRLYSCEDSTTIQQVQISGLNTDVMGQVERFQNYGISSNPVGGDVVFARLQGSSDKPIVIVAQGSGRPTGLSSGDVVIYDDKGQTIKLSSSGIEITTGTQLIVNAPNTIINGNVLVNGGFAVASGGGGGGSATFEGGLEISGTLDVTGQTTLQATTINGVPQSGD